MTMGLLPSVCHIVNPKLKHTYLSFNDKGELVVKSPGLSDKEIETLLIQKAAWITQAKQRIEAKKGRHTDILEKRELFFLGNCYPLTLQKNNQRKTTLTVNEKQGATLRYYHDETTSLYRAIDTFYKKETQKIVTSLVDKWAERMQTTPKAIKFRKTKRQWGSCSVNNTLSFNTMLSKLPLQLITYIVVHELAHIRHKHHQKAFWDEVARYMPDFQHHRQTLKAYTTY